MTKTLVEVIIFCEFFSFKTIVASPSLIAVPKPFLSIFIILLLSLIHSALFINSFFLFISLPKKLIVPPIDIIILFNKVVCCTTFNLKTSYILRESGWNNIIFVSPIFCAFILILELNSISSTLAIFGWETTALKGNLSNLSANKRPW